MLGNYNQKKYLGIDWGEKRIGLALADGETKLALPFKTVADLSSLISVINDEEIDVIILGNPQKMNGDKADNRLWLNFYNKLQYSIPQAEIILIDERLSSLAADALFGLKKQKAGRDEIAASLLLQAYLDASN